MKKNNIEDKISFNFKQKELLESLSSLIESNSIKEELNLNSNNYYFLFWKDFGLFDKNYKLTKLAKSINLKNEDTISKYFDTVLFNYVLDHPMEEKKYNPLLIFLEYCDNNNLKKIKESDIQNLFYSFFNLKKNQNIKSKIVIKNILDLNGNLVSEYEEYEEDVYDEYIDETDKYIINISKFIFLLLKNTSYFQAISNEPESLFFKDEIKIEKLLKKCNSKYHMKSVYEYEKDNIDNLTKQSYYLGTNYLENSNQRIYYGAAGVGKKYILEKDIDQCFPNEPEIKRIAFHSNYNYSNFIGYKEDGIFIPGHLINIILESFQNPETNYLLVIDGINKANVYDVFGDFIQLIERNKEGESRYKISASGDLKKYLKNILVDILYFPSNLYIWATMISYNNVVYPLDLSFKRKWNFQYITINNIDSKKIVSDMKFKIGSEEFYWDHFRESLNETLLEINSDMNEERLLGPFFIGTDNSIENNTEIIRNKVIPYILEDVLKFFSIYDKAKIFYFDKNWKYLSSSDVIERFDNYRNEPNKIFSSYLIEKYKEKEKNEKKW